MALLSFPPFPVNGELYPLSPVPGQNQYQWDAVNQTWRLVGRGTGVTAGTYGDSRNIPQFTVNSSGAITFAQNVPIAIADVANVGVVKPDGTTITIAPDGTISSIASGTGTVTSVAANGGSTGLTFAGSPITSSGTFTLGGVLGIASGGTGATSAFGARAAIGAGTVTQITAGGGLTGGVITTSGTLALGNSGVTAGSYTSADITVDSFGRITAASNGSGAGGTVTSVNTGVGLTGGPITTTGTIDLVPATASTIGGVYPDGTTITIDLATGKISAINVGTVTLISTGAGLNGGPITDVGSIYLDPATTSTIGGVIPDGTTISVLSDGTISAVNTGTVTQVDTGVGLTGGPITGTGTVDLVPATTAALGGVIPDGTTISVAVDGTIAAVNNGTVTQVSTGVGLSGGPITNTGTIVLDPATTTTLGGVIPDGVSITVLPDGTISAISGGGGTVTSVNTGVGLTGGPIVAIGTIDLVPATSTTLGGVIPDGVTIAVAADGTISAVGGSGVTTVNTGTGLSGGPITTTGTVTLDIATTTSLGGVIPDGTTITVDGAGTISAVGSGLSSRTVVSGSTASINDLSLDLIDITGFKSYALMQIECDGSAWVRVYTDPASRINDLSRNIGNDPNPGSGVIAEANIVSPSTVSIISPFTVGGNLESPVTDQIYLTVQNLSGATRAFNVSLTILQLEI